MEYPARVFQSYAESEWYLLQARCCGYQERLTSARVREDQHLKDEELEKPVSPFLLGLFSSECIPLMLIYSTSTDREDDFDLYTGPILVENASMSNDLIALSPFEERWDSPHTPRP